MTQVRTLLACVTAVVLMACSSSQVARNNQGSLVFPASEFSRVLSQAQRTLVWEKVSEQTNSHVWLSSNSKLIAITKNGRAISLIEPDENWTTYYLFGADDKIMKYRVNGRETKGALVDFVYEAL